MGYKASESANVSCFRLCKSVGDDGNLGEIFTAKPESTTTGRSRGAFIDGFHCRHAGGQNKRKFVHKVCIIMKVNSQRRKMVLFLSTNMAAMTSHANHQYGDTLLCEFFPHLLCRPRKRRPNNFSVVRSTISESQKSFELKVKRCIEREVVLRTAYAQTFDI